MTVSTALTDDQIAVCRDILLSAIGSDKEKKSSQKEALKKMLSALIAARNSGMSFETIQALLNKAGMSITANSLRNYYFALRKELEISVAEKSQAKKIAATKAAIQKKLIFRDLATLESPVSTLPGTAIQQAEKEKRSPAKPRERENKRPVTIEITPNVVSSALLSVSVAAENIAVAMESPVPTTVAAKPISSAAEAKQEAQTLEEIEALSLEREKDDSFSHPSLPEDVILQDGLVYFASGKPYVGTLKKKQIYLLRESGRLIAPTPSRTGKDFVTMPRVL